MDHYEGMNEVQRETFKKYKKRVKPQGLTIKFSGMCGNNGDIAKITISQRPRFETWYIYPDGRLANRVV